MSWLTETQTPSIVRDRALKSLSLPLGFANPLWLAFGAAASAGAAWWLMTRWARPVNLEVMAWPRTSDVLATEPEPETPALELVSVADDDLTRLVGVGPRSAEALAERGVTRFAQLADWTAEEMATFDAELKLKGRSLRDAWLDQARRLSAAN